jgi:hypothetical protein
MRYEKCIKIVVGTLEGKRSIGRPKCKCTVMDVGFESVV